MSPVLADNVETPVQIAARKIILTVRCRWTSAIGVLRDGVLRDGVLRDGVLRDGVLRDGVLRLWVRPDPAGTLVELSTKGEQVVDLFQSMATTAPEVPES